MEAGLQAQMPLKEPQFLAQHLMRLWKFRLEVLIECYRIASADLFARSLQALDQSF